MFAKIVTTGHVVVMTLLFSWGGLTAAAGETKNTSSPPRAWFSLYAMDTGLRGADVPDLSSKVLLLKKLGYKGIGYTYNASELPQLLPLLDENQLELSAIYLSPRIDEPLDPSLKESIQRLKGRHTLLELALRSKQYPPSDPRGDKQAVALIQELADLVGDRGPLISIYPHTGLWAERVEDGVRLARQVQRKTVGTHFNLVHWKWVKQTRALPELLREAQPHLFCVTINGLDGRRIVSLDRGDHDLDGFLHLLREVGYRGPVGLQGYGIPGPSAEPLQRSMIRWREAMKKLPS